MMPSMNELQSLDAELVQPFEQGKTVHRVTRRKLRSRVRMALQMSAVLALSLLLVAYIGYGESSRTYPGLEMDKLASQGEIIKEALRPLLLAGIPLEQIPGFNTLTQPILDSEPSIFAIYVTNPAGQIVFANTRSRDAAWIAAMNSEFGTSPFNPKGERYTITSNDLFLRTTLELNRRFENVPTSYLHVLLPRSIINQTLIANFMPVPAAGTALLALYFVYVFIRTGSIEKEDGRWLSLAYGLIFFVMALIINLALVKLYTGSIQGKTQALASSLTQRLDEPLRLGLRLDEFGDLDQVFREYQALNPTLSYIGLTVDNQITIHTDPALVGQMWSDPSGQLQVSMPLTDGSHAVLHVGTPTSVLLEKLWRSAKNFAVLFVASAFLSLLFFRLMRSFTTRAEIEPDEESLHAFNLGLINPFYFLAVFIEALASSFLPQYLRGLARAGGVDEGLVSTIFTVYFLAFVLALVPSGAYAERKGPKSLMLVGVLLTGISLLAMTFVTNIYVLFAVRALAGFGQGMLFIGVQSYILQMASDSQKTRAAAIIVFGYQGGTISGTAIGALLVAFMGEQGVFMAGAIISAFALWYVMQLVPRTGKVERATDKDHSLLKKLRNAACDFEFMKTMLFVGIPTKAVLTGVTVFALPLLLSHLDYAQEDIGQIIMLYAAGVLISSAYVARLVDRIGKTGLILFLGTLGGGIGLFLIGIAGWEPVATHPFAPLPTLILIVGMFIVGLAHGFIHAPIVTHIGGTHAAETLGKSSATSLYRLLERMGHVAGPMIVSQVLLFNGETLFSIRWVGVGIVILGLLFLLRVAGRRPSPNLSPSA
jgi:MFS family permease